MGGARARPAGGSEIGGSTLGSLDTSLKDLVTLQQEGTAVVVLSLIHI